MLWSTSTPTVRHACGCLNSGKRHGHHCFELRDPVLQRWSGWAASVAFLRVHTFHQIHRKVWPVTGKPLPSPLIPSIRGTLMSSLSSGRYLVANLSCSIEFGLSRATAVNTSSGVAIVSSKRMPQTQATMASIHETYANLRS